MSAEDSAELNAPLPFLGARKKIPHTAQEALIAELLGDVGILTDNIKSLREALPFLVEDVSTRLRGESSRFIEAADRLTAVLDAIVQYVDSHAEQAVQAEVDKIKAELRLSLNAAAAEALRGAIGQEILTVLRKIEDAGMSFSQEVNKSSEMMSRHRRSSSVAVTAITCFVGAIAGSAISLFAAYMFYLANQ